VAIKFIDSLPPPPEDDEVALQVFRDFNRVFSAVDRFRERGKSLEELLEAIRGVWASVDVWASKHASEAKAESD